MQDGLKAAVFTSAVVMEAGGADGYGLSAGRRGGEERTGLN